MKKYIGILIIILTVITVFLGYNFSPICAAINNEIFEIKNTRLLNYNKYELLILEDKEYNHNYIIVKYDDYIAITPRLTNDDQKVLIEIQGKDITNIPSTQ